MCRLHHCVYLDLHTLSPLTLHRDSNAHPECIHIQESACRADWQLENKFRCAGQPHMFTEGNGAKDIFPESNPVETAATEQGSRIASGATDAQDNPTRTLVDKYRRSGLHEDARLIVRAGAAELEERKRLPTSMVLKMTIVNSGILGSLGSVVKERSAAAGYVMSAFNITSAVVSAILVFVKWRAGRASAERERRDWIERRV